MKQVNLGLRMQRQIPASNNYYDAPGRGTYSKRYFFLASEAFIEKLKIIHSLHFL